MIASLLALALLGGMGAPSSVGAPSALGVPPSTAAPRPAELTGVVQPSRVVRLGAGIDGILSSVVVERGDRVKAGDILATLVTDVERANADLARARRDSTAARESARARVEQARRKLARHESLVADGIVSSDEIDGLRVELRLAEFALKQAEENEYIAQLEYERAAALLAQGTIRTPIDGVVVERFLSPGELVSRSGASEVAVVARLDPLVVELHAPLELLEQLRPGQSAEVLLDGGPTAPVQASITVLGRIVDTASSTFPVRLELPNPDLSLPAGVRCRVRFPASNG